MDTDSLSTARAIRQPIKTTDDIYNAFDGLTYDKGGGVLAMFESYLGEDAFREGVRRHMRRFADGIADVRDFMESLAKGRNTRRSCRRSRRSSISPACRSFVSMQAAKTRRRYSNCRRRLTVAASNGDARSWRIPVCLRDLTGTSQMCVMLDKPSTKLSLITRCSTAWMPNARGAGYYRFALPPMDGRRYLAGSTR